MVWKHTEKNAKIGVNGLDEIEKYDIENVLFKIHKSNRYERNTPVREVYA